jgi:hypothetical protein
MFYSIDYSAFFTVGWLHPLLAEVFKFNVIYIHQSETIVNSYVFLIYRSDIY